MVIEKFKLYSVAELSKLPDPEWQIDKYFSVGQLVGVYGPPAHGKSFVALGMSACVSQGTPWQGHAVRQGTTVYVAAEGGRGIRKRVTAWLMEHGLTDASNIFLILEGVQFRDADDVDLVLRRIREKNIEPQLIVVDTFARCFVGGDENSAKEVGEFIAGAGRLQRDTGATVMVVHHTGKKPKDLERGSSALRAAADVMLRVTRKADGTIVLHNDKQKDNEEAKDLLLRLQPVIVGRADGANITSCVVRQIGISATIPPVSPKSIRILAELELFEGGVASTSQLCLATSLKDRNFHDCKDVLLEAGMIRLVKKGRYAITDVGRAAASATATNMQTAA